jgi:hypothetical protein
VSTDACARVRMKCPCAHGSPPLSGAMKMLKRDLRAPYWEALERNIG